METSGIVPTMEINHGYNNDGFGFGGSGLWLFAILALMWGGNGFFGKGNNGNCATVEDLANQSNFTRLESQGTALGQAVSQGFTNIGNGICNSTYELRTAIDGVSRELATCCCGLSKEILDSKYATAQEINALSAKIDANKIEALQAKVNELQLNQALCGVVRYPTHSTYAVNNNPFCGNCCNGNI